MCNITSLHDPSAPENTKIPLAPQFFFFLQNPKIPSPAPTNHLLEKNFFFFFFPKKE
jgi:hypothetical protein